MFKLSKSNSKRIQKLILFVLVAIAATAGLLFVALNNRPLIRTSDMQDATFPIYAPTREPDGYKLDQSATKIGPETFSFTFTDRGGQDDIVVTMQPVPGNFDMAKLIGGGSVTSTTTDLGVLYDLSTSDKAQYLLKTDKTLIFITSASSINIEAIKTLVAGLSRV